MTIVAALGLSGGGYTGISYTLMVALATGAGLVGLLAKSMEMTCLRGVPLPVGLFFGMP